MAKMSFLVPNLRLGMPDRTVAKKTLDCLQTYLIGVQDFRRTAQTKVWTPDIRYFKGITRIIYPKGYQ